MSSPPPVDPPPPVGKFFINQLAPRIIPASLAALYIPLVNLSPFNVLSSSRRPAATPATVPTPAPAIVAPYPRAARVAAYIKVLNRGYFNPNSL